METLEEAALAYPDVSTIESAALFLSQIAPDKLSKLDILPVQFPSPEAFAAVLWKEPGLHNLVKQFHSNKDFTAFWAPFDEALYSFQIFVQSPPALSEALSVIEDHRPSLVQLAQGSFAFTLWEVASSDTAEAAFVNSLKIIQTSYHPALELLSLGSFQNTPILCSRVDDLFTPGSNTFLMNSSGTGKTRLLLEGLCKYWGFYIPAVRDVQSIGSLAMEDMINQIRDDDAIVKLLPPPDRLAASTLQLHNSRVIQYYCNIVLLAHILVFRVYLEVLSEPVDGRAADTKRQWLKYHSLPSAGGFHDVVDSVKEHLRSLELHEVAPLIKKYWAEVQDRCRGPFFLVLDEANVPARMLPRAFRNEEGVSVPLLHEILRCWRTSLGESVTIIVAGTDVPKEYFRTNEWSSFRWSSNTGSFDNRNSQERYLQEVVPSSILSSRSGKVLQERMWWWCRHRHRFTAGFVGIWISSVYKHPHRSFRDLVQILAGYEVKEEQVDQDEDIPARYQPPKDYPPFIDNFRELGDDTLLKAAVHESVFHCLVTTLPLTPFHDDHIDLVRHGVARFIDAHMSRIVIDEPMMLCAAASWLYRPSSSQQPRSSQEENEPQSVSGSGLVSSQDFATLFTSTSARTHNPACFLAWYIAHVYLQKQRPNHLLAFANLKPGTTWAKRGAQLMLLRRSPMGRIHQVPVDASDLGLESPPLAFRAESNADVVSFLRIEQHAVFCLCPDSCSADLIFALKLSNEKLVWVFLRCRDGGPHGSLRNDIESVVESLLPENIFHDAEEKDGYQEWMEHLPNPLPRHPVLRVVATFPDAPDLRFYASQKGSGLPVAALASKLFENTLAKLIVDDIIEGVVASVTGKRRQPDLLEDEVEKEKPVAKSSRKRKAQSPPPRELSPWELPRLRTRRPRS